MNMPPPLMDAAFKKAEELYQSVDKNPITFSIFFDGVQWLYDHLMKSELEFDEKATALYRFEYVTTKRVDTAFVEGARYQFEQMKTKLCCCFVYQGGLLAKIAALEAENDKLRINAAEYYGVRP